MKVLCGAFDGITARAAQAADFFDGCYMGGQAAAASLLGVPDLGLVCGCEQTKHAQDLASCVEDVYKRQGYRRLRRWRRHIFLRHIFA